MPTYYYHPPRKLLESNVFIGVLVQAWVPSGGCIYQLGRYTEEAKYPGVGMPGAGMPGAGVSMQEDKEIYLPPITHI